MKKKVGPSLYFASDKVIFDALNHRQVNTDLIRELFLERGIITSAKTPKEDLALYFSRLPADYFDHKSIAAKLGRISKRERITFAEIKNSLTSEQILDALGGLKEALAPKGCPVSIQAKDDRFTAVISYEHIDYTETEFRQVQPRDAVIEFSKDASGATVIRSTQNSFTDTALEHVLAALSKVIGAPPEKTLISLEGRPDPKDRITFFDRLVRDIEGHDFVTVTEAYCFKPKKKSGIKDEDEEDDDGDVEKHPHVERVNLKGTGVTKSFVAKELYDQDYYVVKVVWRVRPKGSLDADVYELEAQFGEPESCTSFSYQARSVIVVEAGKPTEKKRAPKREEEDRIFRLIEAAAKKVLKGLEG